MFYLIFFIFVILFAINVLIIYLKNWEDDRPDLGGFGGKK